MEMKNLYVNLELRIFDVEITMTPMQTLQSFRGAIVQMNSNEVQTFHECWKFVNLKSSYAVAQFVNHPCSNASSLSNRRHRFSSPERVPCEFWTHAAR